MYVAHRPTRRDAKVLSCRVERCELGINRIRRISGRRQKECISAISVSGVVTGIIQGVPKNYIFKTP